MAGLATMALLLFFAQMASTVVPVSLRNDERDSKKSDNRVESHNVWVVLVGASRNW